MTSKDLVQMALSAILRCKENVDFFELIDILCGKLTNAIERKGYYSIKTFGAGKSFKKKEWYYWLIQMIQQEIIFIDYNNKDYLKVLEKGHQVLRGELDITLERLPRKSYKINGCNIIIDSDIVGSIDWHKFINEFSGAVYWNYKEERRVNVNDFIPYNTKEKERVKAKILEIVSKAYNFKCEEDVFVIPKKIDYDMYGNEVKALSLPFEECLARLEHFVKTTGRYPQMNTLADEVALRKWYREVGHGIIDITPEQKELFRQFKLKYPVTYKKG